ncbi:Uncharacterised protein [Moraxella caprae]|uniref:Uncharacterized protein n=1 Tax=Moraxella caprae TaxID=90240 RepID=A0A378R1T5_9GAMM|nr:hypothetical protein [Moraxella caprae]STZ08637.1 Uncharacterised protein [Moraxella caprae]
MTDRFILQEVLTDDVPFRVHNVKIDKFIYEQDLPLMLLAHYDRLSDELKIQKPLTDFFGQMNDKVTTAQACAIFGVSPDSLRPATHIKITGTSVIVWDEFPLALHLQFTNTAKDSQTTDERDITQAVADEIGNILLSGNVNVLHKNTAKELVSIDLSDDEFVITPSDNYTRLPNSHALATTQILNHIRHTTPQAMAYLSHALRDKIMEHVQERF